MGELIDVAEMNKNNPPVRDEINSPNKLFLLASAIIMLALSFTLGF